MIKHVLIAVFTTLILLPSCRNRKDRCIRPYSQKELIVQNFFKSKNMMAEFSRFNYPYDGDAEFCYDYITYKYTISIGYYPVLELINKKKSREFSKFLIKTLYEKIVENSIIYYSKSFEVKISCYEAYNQRNSSESITGHQATNYTIEFLKSDIEKYVGFKVIEKEDGTYKRVYFNKKSNPLPIEHEILSINEGK